MFSRTYCFMFFAVAGLLFAFDGLTLWSSSFFILGTFPFLFGEKTKKTIIMFLLVLSIGALFFVYGNYYIVNNVSTLSGEENKFIGKIVSDVKKSSSSGIYSFQFLLQSGEKLQVLYSQENTLHPLPSRYDSCNLRAELDIPSTPKNPYSFDYRKYLFQQKIHWTIYVNQKAMLCNSERGFLQSLNSVREKSVQTLLQKENIETAALISALVFGERSHMDEDRLEQFRQLGILHLLAVSGLHVGLVTAFLFTILLRAGLTKEKTSTIVFYFLPFYIFIAGGAPSVIRASLMCMVFLIIVKYKINIKGLDVISLVCISLLLINPFYIYHLGFQLSFLTSFCLILSKGIFRETSQLVILTKVTVSAQLVSLPLSLFHSYDISIFTIPINIVYIPFISIWILPLSFATVIFEYIFPPLAQMSYQLISISLQTIQRILDFTSNIHWGILTFGKPEEWLVFIMYICIFTCMVLFEKKRVNLRVTGCLIVMIPFLFQLLKPYLDGEVVITMLDVGQGDAIVMELPYRQAVYLIDTGGVMKWGEEEAGDDVRASAGPGKYVIEPFLKARGIKMIDRLILSHGHTDHIGETCYLSERFVIKKALYPKPLPISGEGMNSLTCLKEDNVKIEWAEKGMKWVQNNYPFYILNPEEREKDENNRSIVMLAYLEGQSILFTGDLEEQGERKLIDNYPNLSVDILKVPHHGSNTSSGEDFLQHLSPDFALINVGENNRYGHPHQEVLDRLKDQKSAVYRTDEDGAIKVTIKKGVVKGESFLQRKEIITGR